MGHPRQRKRPQRGCPGLLGLSSGPHLCGGMTDSCPPEPEFEKTVGRGRVRAESCTTGQRGQELPLIGHVIPGMEATAFTGLSLSSRNESIWVMQPFPP